MATVIKAKHYGETEERLAQDPIVIAMAHGLADVPREQLVHEDGESPRFEFMQSANSEYRSRGGEDGGHIGAVAHALLKVLDSGAVKPTKVVTYFASRDSLNARGDEDRAMGHASIISGEADFDKARAALTNYMVNVEGASLAKYPDKEWAVNRMAAIFDAVQRLMYASFSGEKNWEALNFDADGIRFQLGRISKDA